MKKLIFLIPVIALILITVILSIINKGTANTSSNVRIVAAENFWGDISKQIGGDKVSVISIITNPNQDPHQYDSTSNDAKNISKADIVIENGVGYDPFMEKILSATNGKSVINVGDINGLQPGDNPHVWYDTNLVMKFASSLRDDLKSKDPSNSSVYDENYNKFIKSLAPIESLCQSIKNKYNDTPVIATERVDDYMLTSCGLSIIKNDFQKAIEEGNDPSIQSINFFEGALENHEAKLLIYNKQTESQITQHMQALARNNNIPIVGVSETMPSDTNYQQWMLTELQNTYIALSNGK